VNASRLLRGGRSCRHGREPGVSISGSQVLQSVRVPNGGVPSPSRCWVHVGPQPQHDVVRGGKPPLSLAFWSGGRGRLSCCPCRGNQVSASAGRSRVANSANCHSAPAQRTDMKTAVVRIGRIDPLWYFTRAVVDLGLGMRHGNRSPRAKRRKQTLLMFALSLNGWLLSNVLKPGSRWSPSVHRICKSQ